MKNDLRLVTLNIDGRDNIDGILKFLAEKRPDVVCLQEICEVDLGRFDTLFPTQVYLPMTNFEKKGVMYEVGFAVMTAPHIGEVSYSLEYYVGKGTPVVDIDESTLASRQATTKRGLVMLGLAKRGVRYRIAATHFTWTPDGKPSDYQKEDLTKLLELLSRLGELVLCGDFNAPRGGEIFSTLAERFKDNVPPECLTSIDPNRHKFPGLRAMVDGLFSTPGYTVSDVEFTFDLSDHAALCGTIAKK